MRSRDDEFQKKLESSISNSSFLGEQKNAIPTKLHEYPSKIVSNRKHEKKIGKPIDKTGDILLITVQSCKELISSLSHFLQGFILYCIPLVVHWIGPPSTAVSKQPHWLTSKNTAVSEPKSSSKDCCQDQGALINF